MSKSFSRSAVTKVLATTSLTASLALSLTGCNDKANANALPASTNTSDATTATYQVSITSATPPFAFLDEKGLIQGMDVDIIRKIGEIEGFKVNFKNTDWNGMFKDIDANQSDIAVSGISYTPERNDKYALSKSYLNNPSAIMFTQGKINFQSLNDLKAQTVATTDGGKSLAYGQSVPEGKVVTEKNPYLLLQKVVRGEAVGAIYDQPVLVNLTQNHPEYKMTIVPLDKANDPTTQTVILMSKTKPSLTAKVNDGLAKLEQTGELAKIKAKWGVS